MTAPYRLQIKSFPPAAPPVEEMQDEAAAPDAEELVQQHEWSGDLFEDVESITDPAVAFASLKGTEGEEAWLDRAEDGTLIAWVRDTDGSVYRYTDPDAWSVDVDDAQMVRVASNLDDGQDETEPDGLDAEDPEGAGDDPAADPAAEELDPAAEEVDPELDPELDPALDSELDPEADLAAEGEEELAEEDEPVEGEDPDALAEDTEVVDPAVEPVAEEGAEEPEEEDEDEDWKKKLEGKSIAVPGGTYRLVVRTFG